MKSIKIILVSLFFILSFPYLFSQDILWKVDTNQYGASFNGTKIIEDNNNNVIICANMWLQGSGQNSGYTYGYMFNFDKNGNENWRSLNNCLKYCLPHNIYYDNNKYYYLFDSYEGPSQLITYTRFALKEFDTSGTEIYYYNNNSDTENFVNEIYSGNYTDDYFFLRNIQKEYVGFFGAQSIPGYCRFLLRFYDSLGLFKNYISIDTIKDTTDHEQYNLKDVKQTSDSGYIILSSKVLLNKQFNKITLTKADKFGNSEWQNIYTGSIMYDYPSNILIDNDSGYLVCGYNQHIIKFGDTNSKNQIFIKKFSKDGNFLWAKAYAPKDTILYVTGFKKLYDGGYIICGYFKYIINESYSYYLLRLNKNFEQVWFKEWGNDGYINQLNDVIQTSDSNFVVTGCKMLNYLYVAKISEPVFTDVRYKNNDDNSHINIYPNPTESQINIQLNLEQVGNIKIELYNSLGVRLGIIADKFTSEGTQNINYDISTLLPDVYFVRITTNEETIVKKLIKL